VDEQGVDEQCSDKEGQSVFFVCHYGLSKGAATEESMEE
jgi:hypothetical protein